MFNLTGRTALVTGAGRSVGRGIAESLAAAGAAVAVNDLHPERADEVVDSIVAAGGRATAAPFDVTSEAAVADAVALVEATLGPIDILVNNAGIAESAGGTIMFAESTPENWRPTIELNLYGSMTMIRAVLPGMIERSFGRIIQISSGASSRGLPIGVAAYGAAKAGTESLIRHIAVENGHHGVTANALALGLMNNNDPSAFAAMPKMIAAVPVRRLGTPEEIGAASVWLSSDLGGFCTGQVIHLNGGTVFGR